MGVGAKLHFPVTLAGCLYNCLTRVQSMRDRRQVSWCPATTVQALNIVDSKHYSVESSWQSFPVLSMFSFTCCKVCEFSVRNSIKIRQLFFQLQTVFQ